MSLSQTSKRASVSELERSLKPAAGGQAGPREVERPA